MKKKLMSAAALTLILAMALSLTACGGTKQKAEETPEYVYASSFEPLSGSAASSLSIQAYTDNGAYATSYEVVDRVIPDGVDVTGKTEDELTKYDVYGAVMYFVDKNNNISKLEGYKSTPVKTNDGNYSEFYSGTSVNGIVADSDGTLVLIESVYTGWYDGPAGKTWADDDYYTYYKYTQDYYLRRLAQDGSEISSVPLEMGQDQYISSKLLLDGQGNVLAAGDTVIMAFGADGAVAYTIDCVDYVQSLLTLSDGSLCVTVWGDAGCVLRPIDVSARALGEAISMPTNVYDPIPGGGDYDFYFTDGLWFCGYKIETETSEKLFNWINCDVNNYEISNIAVSGDGTVTGIISEYDSSDDTYTSERVTIAKVPYSSVPVKETLTLACMWLDYDVRNMVVKFNRSSDSVRIEVKDYSEFNTENDSSIGSQKFLTEMLAGDGADIISLSGLPYRQMAAKGLLEDLYPYIDSDSGFAREDFFSNVLGALEVNGKLYSSCPAFYVNTVIGSSSVVGEGTSWTYDDLDAALATMPEGCDIFDQYTTRGDILQTCLSLDMDSYVDWSAGKCSFDSDQFKALLEFAARFPAQSSSGEDYTQEDSTDSRIKSGKQMLLRTSIYSVDDLYYNSSYFGGSISYIGYPTLSGSGNVLSAQSGYAISSTCADKDAAWQFLRTFFTAKYQKDNVYSIPTNISVFEDKIANAMKVTYMTDDNGEYILDENGEKKMQPRYTVGNEDGTTTNVYAMTQQEADQLREVLSTTTKLYNYDESMINIVTEQAEAFFAGQKTVDEVAKLIQSKAQIYVSEQS